MEGDIPKETPPVVTVSQPPPEKKPFRLNKWHIIAILLVSVIAVQGFLFLSLNSRYQMLNANYDTLANQYYALQSAHSALQDSYDLIQSNYNSLQSIYNSLQSIYNSYVSSYNTLRNQVNSRTLQSTVKVFITPNDATVKNKVVQITGGWSNPSDWNEYWTDMKAMYDWVVNNVEYRSDGLYPVLPSEPSGTVNYREDMWQFPNETLDLLQGDCEDMAILLTSMILSYNGEKYWTECILITGSIGAHAGVQVPVDGGKLTILDPAGKYYTQAFGGIDSKDVSTEINNWLNFWKPQLGSDVYVDRVFSDSLDKSFSSTSGYTTWMYSR